MGRIFSQFSDLNYRNEAEVSQNFVIPFFTQFLRYQLPEIIPERKYPVNDLYRGIKKFGTTKELTYKPDYVICIDGNVNGPKFLIDSKGPNEKLDEHLDQLRSYAAGVHVNLLVITNGVGFRVYDVNELIFKADTIEDLDLKFNIVGQMLSREIQATRTLVEIIKKIDFDTALDKTSKQAISRKQKQIKLEISDFVEYLKNVVNEFENWHIPLEFPSFPEHIINKYPPDQLHTLQKYKTVSSSLDEKEYMLEDILWQSVKSTVVVLGHSGIGKTTLLKFIANMVAKDCLSLRITQIPIYVSLRNYGVNQGLSSLISNSLTKRGFDASSSMLPTILRKKNLFILLDGYDEVHQQYIEDVNNEIDEIINLKRHTIFITSRQIRKPNILQAIYFIIQPLTQDKIYEFLNRQLGDDQYKFLREVNRLGLNEYLRNTLLLIFLILLYKEKEELPSSRTRIVSTIVEKIRDWEKHKSKRTTVVLKWEIIESVLRELAFTSIEGSHDTTITQKQIDEILIPTINKLEENREISKGIDKHQLIEYIALNGFLEIDNDTIYFRHRVLLNYFASKSFALKYKQNKIDLDNVIRKPSWEQIIILSSAHLNDSTVLIDTIAKTNLFLAATCLIEAQNIEGEVVQHIINRLADRCKSVIGEIRVRALWILKRITRKHTTDVLYRLLHDCEYVDVRKVVLEEIAREGSRKARDIIEKYLDWDKGSFWAGSSQGSVAKALSFFGCQEQLKIIDIWKKMPDMFTDMDCREAMLKIVREGKLTEETKKVLLDFYLEKDTDYYKSSKERGLSDVIIEIGDEKFVPRIIASFENVDPLHETYGIYTKTILASYTSERVIKQLIDVVLHNHDQAFMRRECCAALSKSKGTVPIAVFQELLDDSDPMVRYHAIDALKRFPASQIKEDLINSLDDKNALVQSKIFEVLFEKRLFSEILQSDLFPNRISDSSIRTILKYIRKYRLVKMVSFVDWLGRYYRGRPCDRLDIAHTYCIIDEYTKAKDIVTNFFHNDKVYGDNFTISTLAEISIFFGTPFALEIIERILGTIEGMKEHTSVVFPTDLYIWKFFS